MQDYTGQSVTFSNLLPKIFNRLKTVAGEFCLMLLKWIGLIPIHSFRKFFYFLFGIDLTLTSTIHTGAQFFAPDKIKIGYDTIIGKNSFLDGRGQLTIGNHVDIASDVLIYTNQHNVNSPSFGNHAGAVVTKDIPDQQIWGGVPAKKISDRKVSKLNYKLGRPVLFQ